MAVGQVVCVEPRKAETVGHRVAGQRGQLAEGGDPEPFEGLHERGGALAQREQGDLERGEMGARLGAPAVHDRRAPDPGPRRGGERAERSRPSADPRRPAQRPHGRGDHPAHASTMQAAQPVGGEADEPRPLRRHAGADPLQAPEQRFPRLGNPGGIGRQEREPRAARKRLPHPHARPYPERLGGGGHLADRLPRPRLGRQGHRPAQQRRAAARGDRQLEPGQQDGDDAHTNVCSHHGCAAASAVNSNIEGTRPAVPAEASYPDPVYGGLVRTLATHGLARAAEPDPLDARLSRPYGYSIVSLYAPAPARRMTRTRAVAVGELSRHTVRRRWSRLPAVRVREMSREPS